MRLRFTRDFDYVPSGQPRCTVGFKSGMIETVKRECGEAALAAGAAETESDATLEPPDDPLAGGGRTLTATPEAAT